MSKVLKMTWPCSKKRREKLAYQIPFNFGFAFDWLERLNCDQIGCKTMHETLELLLIELSVDDKMALHVCYTSHAFNRSVRATCFSTIFDERLLSRLFYP